MKRALAWAAIGLGCQVVLMLVLWFVVSLVPAGTGWLYIPYLAGPVVCIYWVCKWMRELRVGTPQWTGFFAVIYLGESYLLLGGLFALGFMAAGRLGGGVVDGTGRCIESFWEQLYFSMVTASTLGYGDLTPTNEARVLACSEVILFWLFFAVAILIVNAAAGQPVTQRGVGGQQLGGP